GEPGRDDPRGGRAAVSVPEPGRAGLSGALQGRGDGGRRQAQGLPGLVPAPYLPPDPRPHPEPEGPGHAGLDGGPVLPKGRGAARLAPAPPPAFQRGGPPRGGARDAHTPEAQTIQPPYPARTTRPVSFPARPRVRKTVATTA